MSRSEVFFKFKVEVTKSSQQYPTKPRNCCCFALRKKEFGATLFNESQYHYPDTSAWQIDGDWLELSFSWRTQVVLMPARVQRQDRPGTGVKNPNTVIVHFNPMVPVPLSEQPFRYQGGDLTPPSDLPGLKSRSFSIEFLLTIAGKQNQNSWSKFYVPKCLDILTYSTWDLGSWMKSSPHK